MTGSLWRSVQSDPGYYKFWAGMVLAFLLTCMVPLVAVWWELRGIRKAVERGKIIVVVRVHVVGDAEAEAEATYPPQSVRE